MRKSPTRSDEIWKRKRFDSERAGERTSTIATLKGREYHKELNRLRGKSWVAKCPTSESRLAVCN
jgi:hypothetical protein